MFTATLLRPMAKRKYIFPETAEAAAAADDLISKYGMPQSKSDLRFFLALAWQYGALSNRSGDLPRT